ncbi:hypothetical protein D3OALGA1CA_3886 [Olavius algarvensis associated proteobacterium Delta 3]|nr:hypothetical protein D3OALGA1CA_3886 [Olavius algarvensis associated proteobacterium Delta 3]
MKKYVPINDTPPQSIQVGGARGGDQLHPPQTCPLKGEGSMQANGTLL